ncbi:phage tail protein, partial [Bordetella avium]
MIEKFDVFVSWFRRHETFVKGFFIGVSTVLAVMFAPAAWAAATAVWALIAPILAVALPIAALVTLFALLYDDVMNFLDGNDSLIGQISEDYPAIGETVKAMAEAIKTAFGWILEAVNFAWGAIGAFAKNAVQAFGTMGKSISSIFESIVAVVKNAWAYIGKVFENVSGVIK